MAMDRLAKIDAEELQRRMRAAFEQTMKDVAQSINGARDGHLINDSEERCRDVLGEFRRLAYETAAQMRVEATEADPAFSPGGSALPRRGQSIDSQLQRSSEPASASSSKSGRRRDRGVDR
jgi:hypothetical protein